MYRLGGVKGVVTPSVSVSPIGDLIILLVWPVPGWLVSFTFRVSLLDSHPEIGCGASIEASVEGYKNSSDRLANFVEPCLTVFQVVT